MRFRDRGDQIEYSECGLYVYEGIARAEENITEILTFASRTIVYRYFTTLPMCRRGSTTSDGAIFSYVDSEQRMALLSESFAFSGMVHFSTSVLSYKYFAQRAHDDIYLIFYGSV